MAACERGYLCVVCGREVEEIHESNLYLRYVLGEVKIEQLDRLPERHIRCDPAMAQFIVSDGFEPVVLEASPFSKAGLDPSFVADEERRVTRGFLRLQQLSKQNVGIWDYPMEG